MTTVTRQHRYEVIMSPSMDEEMGALAARLGEDRARVLYRAMALYIAVKNKHLDQLNAEDGDLQSPLHVFLEGKNKRTEFIDD